MREVCGSVSGMIILAGVMAPADNPSDKNGRTRNYALVQDIAGEFREMNGSIVCRELLGLTPMGSSSLTPQESPEPSDRTEEYYKTRPCARMVMIAAKILDDYIAEHPIEK